MSKSDRFARQESWHCNTGLNYEATAISHLDSVGARGSAAVSVWLTFGCDKTIFFLHSHLDDSDQLPISREYNQDQ